jgi:RHS repeat-associated protein
VGNVIALTDTAKQVRRTYEYDAWGKAVGGTDYAGIAGADRARFKGALWLGDETELYYMRARWYEPKTGRFLSEDPIGLEGGINPYVFAGDDPINRSDPSGLDDVCGPAMQAVEVVITLKDGTQVMISACAPSAGGPSFRGPRGSEVAAMYLAGGIPQGWQGSLWDQAGEIPRPSSYIFPPTGKGRPFQGCDDHVTGAYPTVRVLGRDGVLRIGWVDVDVWGGDLGVDQGRNLVRSYRGTVRAVVFPGPHEAGEGRFDHVWGVAWCGSGRAVLHTTSAP